MVLTVGTQERFKMFTKVNRPTIPTHRRALEARRASQYHTAGLTRNFSKPDFPQETKLKAKDVMVSIAQKYCSGAAGLQDLYPLRDSLMKENKVAHSCRSW
jgi:hypothetical protein